MTMKVNKKVRELATMGLGLMLVVGLVLVFLSSEADAKAKKKKKLPPEPTPVEIVIVEEDVVDEEGEPTGETILVPVAQPIACGDPSFNYPPELLDTDCDGFPDIVEETGFVLLGDALAGVTTLFPGSDSGAPRADRLDKDSPDVFVVVVPGFSGSKLPTDPLAGLDAVEGTLTFHQVNLEQVDLRFNEVFAAELFVTDTVRAAGLVEDVLSDDPTGLATGDFQEPLGACTQGTVGIGPSICIIHTNRIEDFVNFHYNDAGDTDDTKRVDDIERLTLYVAAHEIFHGCCNLKRAANLFHHDPTSDVVVMSQTAMAVKDTGLMTFFIGEQLKDEDKNEGSNTGYQFRDPAELFEAP